MCGNWLNDALVTYCKTPRPTCLRNFKFLVSLQKQQVRSRGVDPSWKFAAESAKLSSRPDWRKREYIFGEVLDRDSQCWFLGSDSQCGFCTGTACKGTGDGGLKKGKQALVLGEKQPATKRCTGQSMRRHSFVHLKNSRCNFLKQNCHGRLNNATFVGFLAFVCSRKWIIGNPIVIVNDHLSKILPTPATAASRIHAPAGAYSLFLGELQNFTVFRRNKKKQTRTISLTTQKHVTYNSTDLLKSTICHITPTSMLCRLVITAPSINFFSSTYFVWSDLSSSSWTPWKASLNDFAICCSVVADATCQHLVH